MKTFFKIILIFVFFALVASINAQDSVKFPISCSIKGPKYGKDSITAVQSISLYRENFKHWRANNYKADNVAFVINPWRFVFLNAPLASQNTYLDGIRIVTFFIDNAKEESTKEKYIDTLMMLYDQNIEAFGCAKLYGEGYILGRKGNDLLRYRPSEKALAYYCLEKSIAIEGSNSEAAILSFFYKTTDELVREGKIDTSLIYENYEKAMSVAEAQLSVFKNELLENPKDSAKINKKIEYYSIAESNINSIFDPWANCEQIISIYGEKFPTKKDDINWLIKLTQLMEKKNCTSDPLYFNAAEEAYKLSPTPEGAYILGKSYLKVNKYSDAIRLLNDAINGITEPTKKADAYLVLAESYQKIGQFANAKSAALKSADINPNDATPYILIGDLYMNTASNCGDNPVTKRAGFWAASDKYAKAKTLASGSDLANIASQRYNSAYSNFPKSEDLFFYNISKGSSYTVSCWYTEVTTVRSVD